ncbi:MAG: hypothetical protein VX614_09020 [Myxococcota bacterium]|nr:hypothetical protein [Myxococcota bacterium]
MDRADPERARIPDLPHTIVASAYGFESHRLRAHVVELGRRERLGRAGRIFFPLLAGALLTLPIPALHLATVPAFLTGALVFGIRRLRERARFERLEGPCPACGREPVWPSGSLRFPLTRPCAECGEFVTLEFE